MKWLSLFLLALIAPLAEAQVTSDVVEETSVTKIAFGSCNNPRAKKKSFFGTVAEQNPDVFLLIGDNIYGDTTDMDVLRQKYQELGEQEGFQALRGQCQILATWDDHDYGVNDGGKSYTKREESQEVFLEFFEEPADSVRHTRPGIYTSYSFGEPGQHVQIIVLDTRYFRDELPRWQGKKEPGTVGWYAPIEDTTKTLLGEDQWAWLEEQLKVKADVRIIASSIQMLAHEKGMENWGNVPHERERLFELLREHQANHTVAISGDVHYTELSRVEIDGYPLYDFTSSGLTNVAKGWANAPNSFRVGDSHWVQNAGVIEIDWESESLSFVAIDLNGEDLLRHEVSFSELEFE